MTVCGMAGDRGADLGYIEKEIEKAGPFTLMFALRPEHITGKRVKEE